MLEAGAPPSAPADTVANVTPLHVAGRAAAALPGHDAKGVVQTLCDFGADLDARDSRGNTPLHAAAGAGGGRRRRGPARRGRRRRRAQHEPGHAAPRAVWHRRDACASLLVRYGAPLARATRAAGRARAHAKARRRRDQSGKATPRASVAAQRADAAALAAICGLLGRCGPPHVRALAEAVAAAATHSPRGIAPRASPPRDIPISPSPSVLAAEKMLDDEEFFDAVVASPTVGPPPKVPFYAVDRSTDDSTVESQGFRDPAPRRRDPEVSPGCAGSQNPLYISSPTASSIGTTPRGSVRSANSTPRAAFLDNPDVIADINREREADAAVRSGVAAPRHRGARGRHLPAEIHGLAAQRAAVEIRHGLLQLPRVGRRGGGPPAGARPPPGRGGQFPRRPRRRGRTSRASASRRRGATSSSKTPRTRSAPRRRRSAPRWRRRRRPLTWTSRPGGLRFPIFIVR